LLVKNIWNPNITDFSGTDPFVPTDEDSTLLDVITDFSVKGLHRTPVIDNHGKVEALLAQSDLIGWFADNVEVLKEVIGNKSVRIV
jgi:CBS-domain-containing membrane protein